MIKTNVLAYHKKLLAEALKEKEDLKTKVENWQNSSKNLSRLLNTQMSANDKFRLGYEDYKYGSILSYENEVLQSVFMNKESDLENTYTSVNESDSKSSEFASCESDYSVETSTSMPEPEENALKVICKPKVENVKEKGTSNRSPKIEKHDRNGHTRKGLGYAFTRKACFVYGSFSHLIRDYDFHEKRMAKQAALTKSKNKVTGQRVNRPVWNNVQRVNHQNKALKDKGIVNSGCSRHMTGNKAHIADYREFKGGSVAFGGSNGRITEAVNTACYVLNRVLVTKPQNKTPYELLTETKRVEENLHVNFLENKPNVAGKGHAWMFDLDYLTNSMNYEPVSVENQANKSASTKEANNSVGDKIEKNTDFKTCENPVSQVEQIFLEELEKLKR
nr:ribonuclease H-like domain-containing protein [Tanacetum cinerariifolium]